MSVRSASSSCEVSVAREIRARPRDGPPSVDLAPKTGCVRTALRRALTSRPVRRSACALRYPISRSSQRGD